MRIIGRASFSLMLGAWMILAIVLEAAILIPSRSHAAGAEQKYLLKSPDERIEVSIWILRERPCWSATFRGRKILTECELGLQTSGAGELLKGVRVVRERSRSVDKRVMVPYGKADHARDRFQERRWTVESENHQGIDLIFRCYDDAVAFRYELPKSAKSGSVIITDETSSFRVAGNPTAYVQYLENYQTSHEHQVIPVRYGEIPSGKLMDLPLTLRWEDGTFAAVTEASLRHYAGMALMRSSNATELAALVCNLTPRPDGTKVMRPLPMQTPWRVVLVGDRPGALLESGTLYCLNDPSVIKDVAWIKPGKITFSWWNGDVFDGKRSSFPILSFQMAKKYIDFCASNGIPTHSLTSTENVVTPWYHQSTRGVAPGPDTDVTRPRDGFPLAAIREYAEAKKVHLWTWVHQGALRGRVEEAVAALEKMGWSGMMVDFFDHDDQESIEFAESILQSAARHHIMIHLHGVWKPSGWERTYPNLMNHEGALNLEYLKWSNLCTPEHNLMMAFTRLIAGPMDYHLGGFRSVPRTQFKSHNLAPNVLGTRCHMLAMYVCFDNPNPMVADYPMAYEAQPGFDFIKLVPTWWDETRVLAGEVGELLVTARRKGKTWYLGGMSARREHELDLPLTFLRNGRYAATVWKDAPDVEVDPNHLLTETVSVSKGHRLQVRLAMDGGFVAQINPRR